MKEQMQEGSGAVLLAVVCLLLTIKFEQNDRLL